MKTDIETSLNRAVDRMPHPTFADIADPPVKKMEEMDYITRQEPIRRRNPILGFYRYAVPALLCLLLVLPGARYVNRNLVTDSVIDLDVNPSIEITVNQKESVLKVSGINEDAKAILGSKDYRGWTVEAAVEDIVILLNQKDYISKDKNTILLSVSSRSAERAERVKQEVYDSIGRAFGGTDVKPVVIRQNRTESKDIRRKASQHLISPGKMQLIEELAKQAPDLSEDELAQKPVEELYRMIRSGRTEIPDWLEIDEDDWDDWEDDDDSGGPDEDHEYGPESDDGDEDKKDGRDDGDEDGRDEDDRDDDDSSGRAGDDDDGWEGGRDGRDDDDGWEGGRDDRDDDDQDGRPGGGRDGRDHDDEDGGRAAVSGKAPSTGDGVNDAEGPGISDSDDNPRPDNDSGEDRDEKDDDSDSDDANDAGDGGDKDGSGDSDSENDSGAGDDGDDRDDSDDGGDRDDSDDGGDSDED